MRPCFASRGRDKLQRAGSPRTVRRADFLDAPGSDELTSRYDVQSVAHARALKIMPVPRLLIDGHQRWALRCARRDTWMPAHAEELELSLVFCDDKYIAGLNQEWRGVAGPTDVLSLEMVQDSTDAVWRRLSHSSGACGVCRIAEPSAACELAHISACTDEAWRCHALATAQSGAGAAARVHSAPACWRPC